MEKTKVIKSLIKRTGCGLPQAIKIYNELSANGFYAIEKEELNKYIKENF